MKELATYITTQPDELIMQCIAITRAAINTEDIVYRELLLYVLIEKQINLAKATGCLSEEDLSH